MNSLVVLTALSGILVSRPSIPDSAKMHGPPQGTWRVLEIIDGAASARTDKIMQFAGRQVVVTDGEAKEEFLIVSINPSQGIGTIDLRDKRKLIYRGILQQQGKRLTICVQFWIQGNAKESVRPTSFTEADHSKMLGPTLYILEEK
jgi:uncharacterized protein (TIGR03067 family)